MKAIRRTCAVSVMALVLSLSVSAGDMHFPVTPPPPSQPATQGDDTNDTNGTLHTGITEDTSGGAGSTLEAALGLMRAVLSII